MTSEIERIKILEGKITQVVDYINTIVNENEKLKQQIRELKAERKSYMDQARKAGKLDDSLKILEKEREAVKAKVEKIISQIEQLEL